MRAKRQLSLFSLHLVLFFLVIICYNQNMDTIIEFNDAAFNHEAALSITVDSETANYLTAKAFADHKTPAQIIGEKVNY